MRVQIIDIPMDTRQANTTVNEALASIKGEIKDQQVLDDRRINIEETKAAVRLCKFNYKEAYN